MKKYITDKKLLFLSVFLFAVAITNSATAAETAVFQVSPEMCELIEKLQETFKLLRILAFLGAGFILAKYGWEAISSGKIGGKDLIEGVKTSGIAMIVGFALLFMVGVVITFILNGRATGCDALMHGW